MASRQSVQVRLRIGTMSLLSSTPHPPTLDLPGVWDQDPKQGTAGPDLDHPGYLYG